MNTNSLNENEIRIEKLDNFEYHCVTKESDLGIVKIVFLCYKDKVLTNLYMYNIGEGFIDIANVDYCEYNKRTNALQIYIREKNL